MTPMVSIMMALASDTKNNMYSGRMAASERWLHSRRNASSSPAHAGPTTPVRTHAPAPVAFCCRTRKQHNWRH